MNDTYTIKISRKFWFDRKLKNVKNFFFPDDMNPALNHVAIKIGNKEVIKPIRQGPVKFMMVVFADERREIINIENKSYKLPKELHYIKIRRLEEESNNQVKVAS